MKLDGFFLANELSTIHAQFIFWLKVPKQYKFEEYTTPSTRADKQIELAFSDSLIKSSLEICLVRNKPSLNIFRVIVEQTTNYCSEHSTYDS